MWLRIWRFRLRLMKDIKQIVKRMNRLHGLIGQELQRSNPEFLRNAETNDNLTNP
jgi:hypothetical protein